jgi:hypothetical protein
VRDGSDYRLRRTLQQIGKTGKNLPVAQANPGIQ